MDFVDNNPALFIHRDEVKAAWQWIDPIIKQWKNKLLLRTFIERAHGDQ